MVGRGLEAPSIVATLLDVTRVPAKPQYNYAPEEPLMLYACEFEGIQWVRRPRALARACEDVRGHMDRHLVAAAMCGAMLDTLLPQLGEPPQQGQQQAAAAADGGGGDGGGGGGGGGGWGAGGPAAAAAAAGHVPLLLRATEFSLAERFRKAGIPLELLNQPGRAGFEGE
jgi:tRNA pseudouridine38/39 synthase